MVFVAYLTERSGLAGPATYDPTPYHRPGRRAPRPIPRARSGAWCVRAASSAAAAAEAKLKP